MQTLFGRTSIINSTHPAKTNTTKLKLKIRFGKKESALIDFGFERKVDNNNNNE